MTQWKWLEDGKTVEVTADGAETLRFEGATVKESEWRGFYERMADEGEAWKILQRAKAAFQMGMADYSNARENLKSLIREVNGSSAEVLRIAQDVDVFFTAPGLAKAFDRDPQGLIEFALEFTARTYTRSLSGR